MTNHRTKRGLALAALAPLGLLLMGADNQGGCGVEFQPGDGSSSSWTSGSVPQAQGPSQAMTCAWLQSDNCWQQLVQAAQQCMASSGSGTWNEDRDQCTLDSGALVELEGPISAPAKGTTLFEVVNHRVLGVDGSPCFTSKILGWGRTLFESPGHQAVIESTATSWTSLTKYRVVCQDGTSYTNDGADVCPDFGLRWLAKSVPGYSFSCNGSSQSCTSKAWGGATGGMAADLFTCE